MGFHLKIKIIHRHVVGGEKKVLQTENLQACITGQIVFVLGSFGSKATRSECLLFIQNFCYIFFTLDTRGFFSRATGSL